MRLQDCSEELHKLLQEERLMGASLLVFKNKSDILGSMTEEDVQQVSEAHMYTLLLQVSMTCWIKKS